MNDINKWIGSFKVQAFDWIDGKTIYFNVQCFKPGQSAEQPPIWDKTVYITANENGYNLVNNFTDTLTNHIASIKVNANERMVITA